MAQAVEASPSSRSPVGRVRELVLQHRRLTLGFLRALAAFAQREAQGDTVTIPTAAQDLPSSYVHELAEVQKELDCALVDLQTHLDLHDRIKAIEMAMFAQSNQIVSLLRTLYSCEQAVELALDQAQETHRALVAARARGPQVDPDDIVNYANKLSGQTSAPHSVFNVAPGQPPLHVKPMAFPDEATMRSGVLFAQHAPPPAAAPASGPGGAASAQTSAEGQEGDLKSALSEQSISFISYSHDRSEAPTEEDDILDLDL